MKKSLLLAFFLFYLLLPLFCGTNTFEGKEVGSLKGELVKLEQKIGDLEKKINFGNKVKIEELERRIIFNFWMLIVLGLASLGGGYYYLRKEFNEKIEKLKKELLDKKEEKKQLLISGKKEKKKEILSISSAKKERKREKECEISKFKEKFKKNRINLSEYPYADTAFIALLEKMKTKGRKEGSLEVYQNLMANVIEMEKFLKDRDYEKLKDILQKN